MECSNQIESPATACPGGQMQASPAFEHASPMPSPRPAVSILALLLACTPAMPAASATSTPAREELYCSLAIPEKVSLDDVRRVLAFVASNRRWVIDSQEPGCTRISLHHQSIRSRVCLSYDGHTLVLRHESVGPDGRGVVPTRWLRALLGDIEKQFSLKQ
jgi:hypothetical protein